MSSCEDRDMKRLMNVSFKSVLRGPRCPWSRGTPRRIHRQALAHEGVYEPLGARLQVLVLDDAAVLQMASPWLHHGFTAAPASSCPRLPCSLGRTTAPCPCTPPARELAVELPVGLEGVSHHEILRYGEHLAGPIRDLKPLPGPLPCGRSLVVAES